MHRRLPELELLQERFSYCKETGTLTVKRTGREVVSKNGRAVQVKVNYQGYLAHRIIWKLVTGEDPIGYEIDHINRNQLDNRWSNLRLATKQENGYNKKANGIRKDKRTGKWVTSFQVDGVKRHGGVHDCPLMAHIAYIDLSRELRGEFSPV